MKREHNENIIIDDKLVMSLSYNGNAIESLSGQDLKTMYGNTDPATSFEFIYVTDPKDNTKQCIKRGTRTYYYGFPQYFVNTKEFQKSYPTRFKRFIVCETRNSNISAGNYSILLGHTLSFNWYPTKHVSSNRVLLNNIDSLYGVQNQAKGLDILTYNTNVTVRIISNTKNTTLTLYTNYSLNIWYTLKVKYIDNLDGTYSVVITLLDDNENVVATMNDVELGKIPHGTTSTNYNNRDLTIFNAYYGRYGVGINSTDYIKNVKIERNS